MNTFSLGLRNAFRNSVRSISIMVILGLSVGLCLVMLIAYQAVGEKIDEVKGSVGNTITIAPAGFNNFSQVNNALTTDTLAKVQSLPHVSSVVETLSDRMTTIGAAALPFGRSDQNGNATTSLTSPVTLNSNGSGQFGGGRLFFSGGDGSLPANFSLPVPIIGTTDPQSVGGSSATLKSGVIIDGSADTNNAMIGTDMASKNNLKVGSTFTAYGTTLTVAGIFDTGTGGGNSTVIVALPTLERLSGQSGAVTNASVTVDSLDNLSSVTNAVKSTLGSSADVESAQDQANAAVQPLQNVRSISLISLIGAVIAGGVIILMTMVMIVRERRREIGILKAIGASNTRVILQFVSEALALTVAGAIVGVLIGIIGGNPVTNTLVSSSAAASAPTAAARGAFGGGGGFGRRFMAQALTGNAFQRGGTSLLNTTRNIQANIGWQVLAEGLAAALVIAIIGSTFAGWMIARVRPSEVMRAE